jgi:hypothetical protein
VEQLMAGYDTDPAASLMQALVPLIESSGETWEEMVDSLPYSVETRQRLRGRDTGAMDDLVKRLVEFRSLEQ